MTQCFAPRKTSLRLVFSAATLLAVGTAGSACSRSTAPEPMKLRVGGPMVQFDEGAVTELVIAKTDARTQDRWTARLARKDAKSEWEIASAPEGRILSDRRADTGFVNHLVALLKTLQVNQDAPEGPLSSFGLEPPLFALRWGNPSQGILPEIRLGDPNPKGPGSWAVAVLPTGISKPVLVRGGALQMLGMIDRFEVLRRRRLATFESDDVDELELWKKDSRQLYAQREGDDWKDQKRKALKENVGARLELLTHLRAESFVDDAAEVGRLGKLIASGPDFRAVFKDRHGSPTELKLKIDSGRTWATISSRPETVFELPAEAVRPWVNRP